MNRDEGFSMVLLQDRVEQATKLLVRCRDCLDYFHNALFPLNPCPEGLLKLLEKFKDGRRIFKFIHREMISGAMSALAWVKVHHQQINLAHVAEGLPDNGQGSWDMRPFYEAAFEPARKIMKRVHEETQRCHQAEGRDIPEMDRIPEDVIARINAEVARRRRQFEGQDIPVMSGVPETSITNANI